MSTLLDEPQLLLALRQGSLDLQGQFLHGSNYTFMAQLNYQGVCFSVVYKPSRGEQPLWDFPGGTLGKREVAAYLVSQALGWELVPPTVYRRRAPLGPGSLQEYVEHDSAYHYFNFQRLRPAAPAPGSVVRPVDQQRRPQGQPRLPG